MRSHVKSIKLQLPGDISVTNIEFEDRTGAQIIDLRRYLDCLDLERDFFKFIEYLSRDRVEG